MRRRQAYALQTQQLRAALLHKTVEVKQVQEVFASVKKTACQFCGKEIGRGLYMHEKHCKAK